jgi:hypothetical protein
MVLLSVLLLAVLVYLLLTVQTLSKKVRSQDMQIKRLYSNMDFLKKKMDGLEPLGPQETVDSIEKIEQPSEIVQEAEVHTKPVEVAIEPKTERKRNLFSVESIITKLGILMLLIGVGYIFKLAYDNGYFTEKLALLTGAFIGFVLIGIGEHVRRKERHILSQVLFGGGIATLFITTYAAYQVYGFISSGMAFVFLSALTLMTYGIALYVDQPLMSVIGVLGGLLTPFMVELDFLGLNGLGIYMLFLAITSMGIYVYKKWRVLQFSTVIGIFAVTGYLVELGRLELNDKYLLATLIGVLYLVFHGVEYVMTYLNEVEKSKYDFGALILGILPLIAMLELRVLLDLEPETWGWICILIAAHYSILWMVLFKKEGYSLITDVLLGLSALFSLFACLLYFEGDILALSIIALGLLFTIVGERKAHGYTKIGGHAIFMIGFVIAFLEMSHNMFIETALWSDYLSHSAVLGFLGLGVYLQKNRVRLIYGILTLELYALVFFEAVVWQLTKDGELMIAAMVLWHGIYLFGLHYANGRTKLVPNPSLLILSSIPLLGRIFWFGMDIINGEFKLYNFVVFVIYGVALYGFAHYKAQDWKPIERTILKWFAFIMLGIASLVDLYNLTEHFGYGLFMFGALVVLMNCYELKQTDRITSRLRIMTSAVWLFLMSVYMVFGIDQSTFIFTRFLVDVGSLGMLYMILKRLNLKAEIQLLMHWLVYLIVIHQNFKGMDGTVTLLWAGYAIAILAGGVLKGQRNFANIALLMIVFVAAKFIIIDLSTVSILWKIITSMVFGSALLILSYVLQPFLTKKE